MADHTHIEWTDATWNPTTGCTKLSQGCKNCYAAREWVRLSAPRPKPNAYTGRDFTDVQFHAERLHQPSAWRKPRRIFVDSMSDLFHEKVTDEQIEQVWAEMQACGHHTFQVLTKRIARARAWLNRIKPCGVDGMLSLDGGPIKHHGGSAAGFLSSSWPLPNVWLGTSTEDQVAANERVPDLLAAPAAVRFLSVEPMLGPVDLQKARTACCPNRDCFRSDGGRRMVVDSENGGTLAECICSRLNGLHWVIAGGESGPHARPSHPDWFRSLRDQCAAAGVPFHFKQWGEWREPAEGEEFDTTMGRAQKVPAFIIAPTGTVHCFENDQTTSGGKAVLRVGKKAAGRLLDGVLHDNYPEAQ